MRCMYNSWVADQHHSRVIQTTNSKFRSSFQEKVKTKEKWKLNYEHWMNLSTRVKSENWTEMIMEVKFVHAKRSSYLTKRERLFSSNQKIALKNEKKSDSWNTVVMSCKPIVSTYTVITSPPCNSRMLLCVWGRHAYLYQGAAAAAHIVLIFHE